MVTSDYEIIDEATGEVSTMKALAIRQPQNQVAHREMVGGLLRPVAAPSEVLAAQNDVRALVAQALQKDRDFGVIPGTNKPTLLKPGAERINAAYGLAAEYGIMEKEIDHDRPVTYVKRSKVWANKFPGDRTFTWKEDVGQSEGLYRFVVECRLIHRASGVMVGQGIGSCSTMESKYIDRPRDLENTVLKMASKRAYIAATLNTHGLSDQFTQDIEDNPEAFGLGKERAPQAEHAAPSEPLPTCPKCHGPVWDNRPKKASGQFKENSPDFACKDKACGGKIWPEKETSLADDAAELDRLQDSVYAIIADIRAIDSARADEAKTYADSVILKEGVKADDLRKLGAVTLAALRRLEAAAVTAPALPTYDDPAPEFPESDELPWSF